MGIDFVALYIIIRDSANAEGIVSYKGITDCLDQYADYSRFPYVDTVGQFYNESLKFEDDKQFVLTAKKVIMGFDPIPNDNILAAFAFIAQEYARVRVCSAVPAVDRPRPVAYKVRDLSDCCIREILGFGLSEDITGIKILLTVRSDGSYALYQTKPYFSMPLPLNQLSKTRAANILTKLDLLDEQGHVKQESQALVETLLATYKDQSVAK